MKLLAFAQQISLFLPKVKTSVWIYGENFDDFETFRKAISAFQNYFPKQHWVFTCPDLSSIASLKSRYIDDFIFLTPLSIVFSRFFQSTNPSALIILRSYKGLSEKIVFFLLKNNIPIIWLNIDRKTLLEITKLFSNNVLSDRKSVV